MLFFLHFFLDLSQIYNTLQSAGASLDRITEYLELETPIREAQNPRRPEGGFAGEISFRNVTFAYEETPIIEDLDLDIAAGERFALVGQTGAGKTTVVNLLARLYDVDEGRIALDGIDLREIAGHDLRRTIAVVPQDVFLFDTSIAENIRYGNPKATDEDIHRIARRVHAHDFISRLPEGYETEVGEGGVRLSGGQRQLVSFARAMLADPTALILDEATSSVDAHTEMLIRDALKELLKDRTSLIIAHRFTTLRRADRIGVMEDGGLTAVGTHEELIARSPIYRELLQKQGMAV
ncbi:MAG: ABC transporter ATP-binding protein [Bacillota bacterium]